MAFSSLTRRDDSQKNHGQGGIRQHKLRSPHSMILLIASTIFLATLVVAYLALWTDFSAWVYAQKHFVKNQLALSLVAIRAGDMWAIWGLIGLCAIYGVVHAVGPGHGKILISAAAVASRRTAVRMGAIGFAASLMQAVSAIVFIYGGIGLFSISSGWMFGATEHVLVSASYVAMSLIGLWLCWRGIGLFCAVQSTRTLAHDRHEQTVHHLNHKHHRVSDHHHKDHSHHGHGPDCGCKHMPTAHDAANLESWRDVAALILSIGIRPCSGALIVLVIAWHFGLYLVGALSAVAMAVGTGTVVAAVAVFATHLRQLMVREEQSGQHGMLVLAGLQVVAGLMVTSICIALLATSQRVPIAPGILR